mgnify:CR=1 FL=1|jgi:hypothetical protein
MKITNQQLKRIIKEEMTMVLKEGNLNDDINAAKAIMNNIKALLGQLGSIVKGQPALSSNRPLKRDILKLYRAESRVNAVLVALQSAQAEPGAPQKKLPYGAKCKADSQCASNFCFNGVCEADDDGTLDKRDED